MSDGDDFREQSSAAQLDALNQLAALGASGHADIAQILNDPSLSQYDRIYQAVETVVGQLDEEVTKHLDALRETTDFDGEMAMYRDLSDKRNQLQDTLTRLYEEENERLRKAMESA
jgi:hypothetical protein